MRLDAFSPAAVGLALCIVAVEIRMDGPWANGVLALVAAVPAAALIYLGLGASGSDGATRAAVTIFLVAGLVLAGLAIARLGHALGGDDFTAAGGTLTWMLALFTALAAFCAAKARSAACVLIAALAAVGLLMEAVNWLFDAEDLDVFRVLLVLSFAALFAAGLAVAGRSGTILVAAAGVTVLAGSLVTGGGLFLLFGGEADLGWGWELLTLLEGVALVAYAAQRLEPGPGLPRVLRPRGVPPDRRRGQRRRRAHRRRRRAPTPTNRSRSSAGRSCSRSAPSRPCCGGCVRRRPAAPRSQRRRRSPRPRRRSPARAACRGGMPTIARRADRSPPVKKTYSDDADQATSV